MEQVQVAKAVSVLARHWMMEHTHTHTGLDTGLLKREIPVSWPPIQDAVSYAIIRNARNLELFPLL